MVDLPIMTGDGIPTAKIEHREQSGETFAMAAPTVGKVDPWLRVVHFDDNPPDVWSFVVPYMRKGSTKANAERIRWPGYRHKYNAEAQYSEFWALTRARILAARLYGVNGHLRPATMAVPIPAASATSKTKIKSRKVIADTGSGNDLMSEEDCTDEELTTREVVDPVWMSTANGVTKADERVDIPLSKTMGRFKPLLMKSSPPVFSVGRRC